MGIRACGMPARAWLIALRLAGAVAFSTIAAFAGSGSAPVVLAVAPGLATVRYDAPLLGAPDDTAAVLDTVSAGSEVELTGGTATGYVEVIANGATGWMNADVLSVSGRPGISMAVTENGAAIYDAPLPDSGVLGEVPAGGAVILTGANVGIYVAGSFEGVGGWLLESDLDVAYDADGSAR